MSRQIIQSRWYDYPQYYDLAFCSETDLEADFIEAACRKYCPFPVRTLLEPACGTGRLVRELAARGYKVTGYDLCEPALAFLRRQLARRRLRARVMAGDMAQLRISPPVDAAYNTFDSFRHLLTEDDALAHLRRMADSVRPGGIYILGIHLLPPDADLDCTERWTERDRNAQVTVTLRVLSASRARRLETLRISVLVRNGSKTLRLRDEFPFRIYTATQFRRLLAKEPRWELCDVYDFWYEIDEPLVLDNEISDTVFVLRRRAE